MTDQAKANLKDGVLEITMPAPPEQVRRHGMVVPAVGGAWNPAPARGREAGLAHQPRHPLAADPDPLRP